MHKLADTGGSIMFHKQKTLAKTITFAITHMTVAFGVVYAMTGSIALGGAVALIEPLCNTVAYYFHEKVWQRISTGNRGAPRLAAA